MKKLALALLVSTALIVPGSAMAANVNVSVNLKNYGAGGTYLAVYVVDSAGNYKQTLWVAGSRSRYWGHLSGWARGISGTNDRVDGLTGPSLGGGRTLNVSANIADSMLDAGYYVVVDSAIENWGQYPFDAAAPLSNGGTGSGKGFVNSVTVQY
ncbi:MAG: DUF2271 domain-containing protein [Hyphomicrobiaceae bacterium]|nr:DUF2271 domain-containing protein [Hyphomicrobiaceae bacterium]MCC0024347.1 DUF2271 domain-containing protein [Hyphomicrobiaceae bacterium]